MKKALKIAAKKYLLIFAVLLIVSAVCLMFGMRKSGMFIDEIYTYGLSNSDHMPFLSDIKGGQMVGTVFTREDFTDYVTVDGDEGFDFGSVYFNQVNDVHPPLYYWLFNIASSLNRDTFSKWTGLVLDWAIYMLALIMLYRLSMKLFGRREIAAAVAVLYGLSMMGLSTMLMIRMYVLLTLLTIWLAYLTACQIEKPELKRCIQTGICIFLGLMTQYYFVFYAFFLCAAYLIYALCRKEYKALLQFALCAFAGVLLLLIVFPASLTHLFADKLVSGGSALDNLKNTAQYAFRFKRFFGEARHGLRAPIYTAAAAAVLLLIFSRKLTLQARLGKLDLRSLIIIVPAFITFILVALISPVDEPRYIYNIAPVFVLAVGLLLYLLDRAMWVYGTDRMRGIALAVIAALALWEARCLPPDYLYPEYREYDGIVEQYSADPCVYFTDNRFEAMTQDLLQLLAFDGVYVTDKEHCTDFGGYTKESTRFVAYFDTSKFWGSGYEPEEILKTIADNTDFSRAELLYSNGLSETYLISK